MFNFLKIDKGTLRNFLKILGVGPNPKRRQRKSIENFKKTIKSVSFPWVFAQYIWNACVRDCAYNLLIVAWILEHFPFWGICRGYVCLIVLNLLLDADPRPFSPTRNRLFKKSFFWSGTRDFYLFSFSETSIASPFGIYMSQVSNRNIWTRCEICSKLTIKTPERGLTKWSNTLKQFVGNRRRIIW